MRPTRRPITPQTEPRPRPIGHASSLWKQACRLASWTGLAAVGLVTIAACSGTDLAGTGGMPVCSTCYEVYINGGIPCGPGPSVDAWHELANNCACEGKCVGACKVSFCQSLPVDMACSNCLATSCLATEMNCASN